MTNKSSHIFYIILTMISTLLIINIIEKILITDLEDKDKKKNINPIYYESLLKHMKLGKVVLYIGLFSIFIMLINPIQLLSIFNPNIISIWGDQYEYIIKHVNQTNLCEGEIEYIKTKPSEMLYLDKTLNEYILNTSNDKIFERILGQFNFDKKKLCNLIKSIELENRLQKMTITDFKIKYMKSEKKKQEDMKETQKGGANAESNPEAVPESNDTKKETSQPAEVEAETKAIKEANEISDTDTENIKKFAKQIRASCVGDDDDDVHTQKLLKKLIKDPNKKNNENIDKIIKLDDSQYGKFTTFNKIIEEGTLSSTISNNFDPKIHLHIILLSHFTMNIFFDLGDFISIYKLEEKNKDAIIVPKNEYSISSLTIIYNIIIIICILNLVNNNYWLEQSGLNISDKNKYLPISLFSVSFICYLIFKFNKYLSYDTFYSLKIYSLICNLINFGICINAVWTSFALNKKKEDLVGYSYWASCNIDVKMIEDHTSSPLLQGIYLYPAVVFIFPLSLNIYYLNKTFFVKNKGSDGMSDGDRFVYDLVITIVLGVMWVIVVFVNGHKLESLTTANLLNGYKAWKTINDAGIEEEMNVVYPNILYNWGLWGNLTEDEKGKSYWGWDELYTIFPVFNIVYTMRVMWETESNLLEYLPRIGLTILFSSWVPALPYYDDLGLFLVVWMNWSLILFIALILFYIGKSKDPHKIGMFMFYAAAFYALVQVRGGSLNLVSRKPLSLSQQMWTNIIIIIILIFELIIKNTVSYEAYRKAYKNEYKYASTKGAVVGGDSQQTTISMTEGNNKTNTFNIVIKVVFGAILGYTIYKIYKNYTNLKNTNKNKKNKVIKGGETGDEETDNIMDTVEVKYSDVLDKNIISLVVILFVLIILFSNNLFQTQDLKVFIKEDLLNPTNLNVLRLMFFPIIIIVIVLLISGEKVWKTYLLRNMEKESIGNINTDLNDKVKKKFIKKKSLTDLDNDDIILGKNEYRIIKWGSIGLITLWYVILLYHSRISFSPVLVINLIIIFTYMYLIQQAVYILYKIYMNENVNKITEEIEKIMEIKQTVKFKKGKINPKAVEEIIEIDTSKIKIEYEQFINELYTNIYDMLSINNIFITSAIEYYIKTKLVKHKKLEDEFHLSIANKDLETKDNPIKLDINGKWTNEKDDNNILVYVYSNIAIVLYLNKTSYQSMKIANIINKGTMYEFIESNELLFTYVNEKIVIDSVNYSRLSNEFSTDNIIKKTLSDNDVFKNLNYMISIDKDSKYIGKYNLVEDLTKYNLYKNNGDPLKSELEEVILNKVLLIKAIRDGKYKEANIYSKKLNVLETKYRKKQRFYRFDTNRDGVIDSNEIENYVNKNHKLSKPGFVKIKSAIFDGTHIIITFDKTITNTPTGTNGGITLKTKDFSNPSPSPSIITPNTHFKLNINNTPESIPWFIKNAAITTTQMTDGKTLKLKINTTSTLDNINSSNNIEIRIETPLYIHSAKKDDVTPTLPAIELTLKKTYVKVIKTINNFEEFDASIFGT